MTQNYYRANEDLRFTPTTPEQEKDLFIKMKAGDKESREFLIRNHLLFAATYARRHNRGRLPDDEAVSAANAALMTAIDRFDPFRGVRFTQFLRPFLRGAMASLWIERNTVEPTASGFPEFTHYQEGTGEDIDDNRKRPCSASQKKASELVAAPDELVADEEERALNLSLLAACKHKLSPNEQELLRRHYEDKIPLAEIAREKGVTRQAVWQAHKQILKKIRAAFKRSKR